MANNAGTVWVDVRGDTSGFLRDVSDGARKATSGLAGIVGSGVKTVMGDIATSAGVAAVGLGVVGAAAVKTSADFNASMSGVSAVAGATAEQMEVLREAALKAGADTAFSASEAATAEAELAKAGVSVADILGGALTGSLGLAAAGQLDLGQAAEISAQALNIFGLAGDQTTRVADTLAAGANKSAADVAQLGDALRQGGLVAKQTGLDLEQTVGVLSLFADSALIGSDAGTSLKTMLQRLVPQSAEAASTMKELGLQFYDANGAFVGIDQVAQQLQDSLGGLSEEQKSAALTTLFGADAIRGASLLMEAGAAGVREYTAAVSDQGAAARMAGEQLNNLKGDLEQFSGSTETALIRVGDLFDGFNRNAVQSATGLVNVFNDFASTPAWTRIQANFDSLATAGGQRIDQLAARLADMLGGISPVDVDRAFSAVEGGLSKIADSAEGLGPVIAGVGVSLASLGGAAVLGPLGGLVPTISPITGALAGLVLGSKEGRDALAGLGDRAGKFATGTVPELLDAVSGLAGELSGALSDAISGIGDVAFDAAESLGPVLADAVEELTPVIGDVIDAASELAQEVLPILADIAGDVLPVAVDVLAGGLGLAADAVGLLTDNSWLLVPALGALAAVKLTDTASDWAASIGSTASAVGESVSDFSTYFQVLRSEGTSIIGSLKGAGDASGGLAGSLTGVLNPAVLGVTAAVSVGIGVYQAWSSAKKRAEEVTRDLADALIEETDLIGVTYDALRANVKDLGVEDAAAKAGLSLRQVSEEIRAIPGAFDDIRPYLSRNEELFTGNVDWDRAISQAEDAGVKIPKAVLDIRRAVDAGLIDDGAAMELINAFVDTDKASQLAADNIVGRFADIKDAANDLNIDITPFIKRFDAAKTFEEQKAVIDELKLKYPELADAIGLIENAADSAAGAVQSMLDKLNEFSGTRVDAERATRDYAKAISSLMSAFAQSQGISLTTKEGIANADAVDRAVEQAKKLADAQALVDRTGQLSRATLLDITNQLGALFENGKLSAEEYAHLIDLYGLTPEEIDTKVNLAIADADAKIADLQAAFDGVKGQIEEPIRNEIQTLLDTGKYDEAAAKLAALGLTIAPSVNPEVDEPTRASVEARLLALPGVTEAEKSKILAELNSGNIAGANALLDALARDRTARIDIVARYSDTNLPRLLPGVPPSPTGAFGVKPARRASGGEVFGPGGPKDDKVPLLGSPGEWVINADAVDTLERKYGPGAMPLINSGRLPGAPELFAQTLGTPLGSDGASIGGPLLNVGELLGELQRQTSLAQSQIETQAQLRQSMEQLSSSVSVLATRPQAVPVVEMTAESGIRVSAREQFRRSRT